MNTWNDATKIADVPAVHEALAAFSEDSTGDSGTAVVQAVLEAAAARLTELELACAQAVEFATYVEAQAKGKMEDAAKHFMSLPFSQELAWVLKVGRGQQAKDAAVARFQEALDAAAPPDSMRLKVLTAEFRGDELEATIVDGSDVRHVGARFSERRTLADLARVLQAARSKGEG